MVLRYYCSCYFYIKNNSKKTIVHKKDKIISISVTIIFRALCFSIHFQYQQRFKKTHICKYTILIYYLQ